MLLGQNQPQNLTKLLFDDVMDPELWFSKRCINFMKMVLKFR